ncbi:MAG TPA: DUF5668 domain-containing protein [Vicinamibacterales bacterium]|jgi:predicted membrane protein|nr:DUF5668 domain-containing protein [Vicinamibacterales bacterium]
MSYNNPAANPRFVIGAGIAIFGFVLMLDRLHLVDAGFVLRLWPLLFVAIGLQRFFNPRPGRSNTQGIFLMAFGGWLLLNTLGLFRVAVWDMIWPVMLIWFGAYLMQRTWDVHAERHSAASTINRAMADAGPDATRTSTFSAYAGSSLDPSADRIVGVAIMSAVKRTSTSAHFQGGELTAFMGGGTIDLRGATILPGQEAVLDLFCIMGGFELLVPQNWVIVTPLIPVMGGIDDKRFAPPPGSADVAGQSAPRLSLRGFVLMGGLTIRN